MFHRPAKRAGRGTRNHERPESGRGWPGGALIIGILDRIKQAVAGSDGDTGHVDPDGLDEATLRQTIVERILMMRQRGPMGIDQLPRVIEVTVEVADDRSVDVVRGYVDDPGFDDEIGAALANRLVGVGASVPMRLFTVGRATSTRVTVKEADGGAWARVRIEGGDRDGTVVDIAGDRPRYHLGRGDWHGDGEAPANDIVLSKNDRFVSRRAAVLRRAGSGLEIASLDQGEFLIVVRPNGQRLRPTHARTGRIRIGIGDALELTDGGRQRIVAHLERRATRTESLGTEDSDTASAEDITRDPVEDSASTETIAADDAGSREPASP